MHTTLITVSELAGHLQDPDWVIIDCRFDLSQPESGREAWRTGHIAGARYAHLDADLTGPKTPRTGRHPLPDADTLAAKLGAWGISNSTQVVAYDAGNGAYAARLWWLLRWLGNEQVAVLDGGFQAWTAAGLPVTTARPLVVPAHFMARPRPEMLVNSSEVLQKTSDLSWRILDARAPERFAGEVEPLDDKAGHIPGAHNHPFTGNLTANGSFRPAAELRGRLQQSLGAVPAS